MTDSEDLELTHALDEELEGAYAQMAQDEERESQALEWAESTVRDVSDKLW